MFIHLHLLYLANKAVPESPFFDLNQICHLETNIQLFCKWCKKHQQQHYDWSKLLWLCPVPLQQTRFELWVLALSGMLRIIIFWILELAKNESNQSKSNLWKSTLVYLALLARWWIIVAVELILLKCHKIPFKSPGGWSMKQRNTLLLK